MHWDYLSKMLIDKSYSCLFYVYLRLMHFKSMEKRIKVL